MIWKPGIERLDPRRSVFLVGQEAVRPGIFRVERRMLLANEIRLHRNPEPVPERFLVVRQACGASTLERTRDRRARIRTAQKKSQALPWLGTLQPRCQRFSAECTEYSRIRNEDVIYDPWFDVRMKYTRHMTAPALRWMTRYRLLAARLAVASARRQIKRLYVEPFTTKAGAEKLREDVIARTSKAEFDLAGFGSNRARIVILGGGGEIWVKGYRSLNPRSGRLPSNGTPVYGGFLSVELRDTKGETLWSYLVTPGAGSEDVSKDLAKRIAKHVAEALRTGAKRRLRRLPCLSPRRS